MRSIQGTFSQHVSQLGLLGRTGEKDSRQIVFDCEKVLKEYPEATIACIFQRNDGTDPYAGAVISDGFLRKVTLTATETAVAGELQLELRAIEGNVVRKSAIFKGYIADSLNGEGDTPGSPLDDVLNRLSVVEQGAVKATEVANKAAEGVEQAAEEAEQAAKDASAAASKAAEAAEKAVSAASSAEAKVDDAVSKAEETTAEAQEKLGQIKSDIETYQAAYTETQSKADAAMKAAEDAAASAKATDTAVQEAEVLRVKAENARAEAETARLSAEEVRVSAESERVSSESARVSRENARVSAESTRSNAEAERVKAESARADAEVVRVSAENERKTQEGNRVDAEVVRVANEQTRQTNESARKAAEEERVTSFAEMLGQASEMASRLKKVEDDYLTSTDKKELVDDIAKAKEEAILAIMGEAGVDEKYDTLKEIADWILSDTTASAELVTRVSSIEKDYLTSSDKTALQKSLTVLEELVGELPEGVASTVVGFVQQVKDALAAEVSAREAAVAGGQAKVEAEASARENADTELQGKIEAEAKSRADADAAEAAARADADSTLQANIDGEVSARSSADAVLHTEIEAEAAARTNADATIENKLNKITDDTTATTVAFGMAGGYLYYEEVEA